ncbi:MFS transporter [Raineyella sp. W15-4]|uniref:MFS transporter n=1 Tax=Raineyella sp. W15-4 TaxID=3081651 RepID=UPI0029546106|nr:MFS transporter [Raineyella sp. W15-4]WOQ15753.1 MFS transporter [Raineyella sp. W15-4]
MTDAPDATASSVPTVPPATRYLVAAILFLTYLLFAVGWRAGDHYVASHGFNASQTALLTNAITIAQVVGSLVAADVLLRLGPRNALTFGSALIIFGGLISLTSAYPLVFFIRFVLGLGGALTVVFMSAIVAKIFTGRELQVVNGVNSVAFNTGLAVALTFAVRMDANPTGAVITAAALSAAILALWLLVSRGLPKERASEVAVDASYTLRDGFREWFNWVFALAYTGLLSYYIVAFTFMDADTVRWVVYAGVIGALSGTAIAAKVPNVLKPRVVVVSAAVQLLSAAAVLALTEHRFATLVGVILGLAIFFPMPFFVQLAFIRPGATPRQISVTFSIFWAVSYAGSVVFIQIFAWIADATGGLGPGNVPVSLAPLVFIVIVEATFLIGAILLARHLARTRSEEPRSEVAA